MILHSFMMALIFSAPSFSSDILYVGDSHSVGCFGKVLDQTLRQDGRKVESYAACGSKTLSWLAPEGYTSVCGIRHCDVFGHCTQAPAGHTPNIQTLLNSTGPKTTIVELGSNMLREDLEASLKDVDTMIAKVTDAKSKCIWIGPPQAATFFISIEAFDHFVQALDLRVTAAGCAFIRSDDKTSRENIKDALGLHYDCENGTAWANKAYPEVSKILEN